MLHHHGWLSFVFLYLSPIIHAYISLSSKSLARLSALSIPDRLSIDGEFLKPLLVPRVSGTPGNFAVRDFLATQFQKLNWTVEFDNFTDTTPFGNKQFSNVIATKNPDAPRRIVLAAHFDSKYFQDFEFIAATDSAVPCALLIDLAYSLNEHLDKSPKKDTTLQIVFFDGEEAFVSWTPTDSTYGSRHLASKWESTYINFPQRKAVSLLKGIEVLVLLDLLGASALRVPNYFTNTSWLFKNLAQLELRLLSASLLLGEPGRVEEEVYFNLEKNGYNIEDDHIPFLNRGVPILHLIPEMFPPMWHTAKDDASAVNPQAVKNLAVLFRSFVAEYLHIDIYPTPHAEL